MLNNMTIAELEAEIAKRAASLDRATLFEKTTGLDGCLPLFARSLNHAKKVLARRA